MRLSLVCLGLAGVAVSSPLLDHAVRDLPDAPTQSTRLVPRSYTRHEKHQRHHLTGWKRAERPRPDQKLPMRIGLKQSNLDRGHDMLMDIASPDSPNYGRHLTVDQVTDLFAPAAESVDAVRHWLTSAGVDARRITQSTNKQWLQFVASVEEAERLLFADYHLYEHLESGLKTVACADYHLPKNVSEHVDYVTPGIKLGSYGFHELAMKQKRSMEYKKGMKAKRRFQQKQSSPGLEYDAVLVQQKQTALPTNCDALVRPKCVQDQYGLPNITNPQPGNELGCFQALNQHYHQPDLDMFYRNVAPHIPKGTHPELRAINGGTGPTDKVDDAGVEADLDLQVIIPLIHPQKAVLFQTDDDWYGVNQQRGDTDYPGFFNTLFDAIDGSYCTFEAFNQTGNCKTWDCRDPEYPNKNDGGYKGELMCGVYKPTNVIAISYSGVENFYPQPYLKRQCMEVMKLGLQGTTIIESSGDHGVGGSRLDPQAGCLGEDARIFAPRTMSNCPYVLSVGATMLVNDTARPGKYRETGTTSFASGGGFSNVFDAPEWQTKHITSYLSTANLSFTGYNLSTGDDSIFPAPNELFNRAGRGYPDVSAVGDNMLVVYQLGGASVKGTSVAVPIWGSVLTMVNEERLAANKTPVGFVHKVLYEHPEVFTDIKEGANPGCGSGGFKVKEGWDPVTGLGSPQYDKLVKLFLSLP